MFEWNNETHFAKVHEVVQEIILCKIIPEFVDSSETKGIHLISKKHSEPKLPLRQPFLFLDSS